MGIKGSRKAVGRTAKKNLQDADLNHLCGKEKNWKKVYVL